MYKIAILKGKEIAREEAINPIKENGRYNNDELWEFNHRISRQINHNYDNSFDNGIEFYCRYVN